MCDSCDLTTRGLILWYLRTNGGGTARHFAMWLGRDVADVRAELERLEAGGAVERWHELPQHEYRWFLAEQEVTCPT